MANKYQLFIVVYALTIVISLQVNCPANQADNSSGDDAKSAYVAGTNCNFCKKGFYKSQDKIECVQCPNGPNASVTDSATLMRKSYAAWACKRNCPLGTAINEKGEDAAASDAETLKQCRYCSPGSHIEILKEFIAGTSECELCTYGYNKNLGERSLDYSLADYGKVCKKEENCPFGTTDKDGNDVKDSTDSELAKCNYCEPGFYSTGNWALGAQCNYCFQAALSGPKYSTTAFSSATFATVCECPRGVTNKNGDDKLTSIDDCAYCKKNYFNQNSTQFINGLTSCKQCPNVVLFGGPGDINTFDSATFSTQCFSSLLVPAFLLSLAYLFI